MKKVLKYVLALCNVTLLLPITANAGIDGTIQQTIPIAAGGTSWSSTWSNAATSYSPTDSSMGLYRWESGKFDGTVTVYFEAFFQSSVSTADNVTVGLFADGNTTTPVTTLTNPTGTTPNRVRSGAITLTDNTDYTIRTKVVSGTVTLNEARIIVVQSSSWPTTITKTQTAIEIGDDFSTTSASYVLPTDTRFWSLPDVAGGTKYDANPLCYLEGTIKTSAGASAATLALVGAAGNGSPLATVSTTSTSFTRVRSAAFTCNSAQDVHPELKGDNGVATASMQNARIVIDQSGAGLSKVQTYLPILTARAVNATTNWAGAGSWLWEPANYSSPNAADMSVTAAASGVTYKVSANTGDHQLCDESGGGCTANTALTGSAQNALAATSYTWIKSGAVTLPATSGTVLAQSKMNVSGTFTATQTYVVLDIVFTGSLRIESAPTSTVLPTLALDGTAQSSTGAVGNIRVKDNRPSTPGWSLTAVSTDFTAGVNTIAVNKASISPTAVTTPNGSSLIGVSAGAGGSLDVSRVLASASSGNGLGTYDENPNETLEIATTTKTGIYTATLTITIS